MNDVVCIVEMFPGVLAAISLPVFDFESHYHKERETVELKKQQHVVWLYTAVI